VINHAVGACTRIKSTPMTLGYVTTLRSFMILWLATFPLALVGEFGWMATPALGFIAYLFINVEQMAVEIEQPFGNDANDLPQEEYIINLQEILLEMTPGYEHDEEDEDAGAPSGPPMHMMMPQYLPPRGSQQQPPPPRQYTNACLATPAYDPAAAGPYPAAYGASEDPHGGWNQVSPDWAAAARTRTRGGDRASSTADKAKGRARK
jgi:hypothetical protein